MKKLVEALRGHLTIIIGKFAEAQQACGTAPVNDY
jgi:hypothetical protein